MVATLDLTRLHKNANKKVVSVACATLDYSDISPGAADINQLFQLPANALITHACMIVETASDDSETVDFGFAGGNELGNDLAATSTGVKQATEVATLTTLTGTVTALTLSEGTPNTLTSGTVALTSGAGTVVHAPRLLTSTGKVVTAVFSAKPTVGRFHFLVEYVEYTLNNGDKTNYVA